MKCEFTYEHYKECIKSAKKLGFSFYAIHDFLDKKPESKFILMRHDVDLSLKSALNIAEIENSLGISSTYFIRTNGIFDVFSGKNSAIIKKISELGHEIGIHYDSDIIAKRDFKKEILSIKTKMEKIIKKRIFGASLHKVKKSGIKEEINKLNFAEEYLDDLGLEYDAYSDIFIRKMKYISDSARKWREGCMCSHIKKENKLCILTHPIWWSSATTSLVTIIEGVVKENNNQL
jgi:hypothetical protein